MRYRAPFIVLAALALAACVYRIDIQQGNLLDDEDIVQVDVGMTRSQVQFLLGTPMVADSFHRDRWDYAYYFRRGPLSGRRPSAGSSSTSRTTASHASTATSSWSRPS